VGRRAGKYIEFKSYSENTSLSSESSAEQLLSYLSVVSNTSELRYIFNIKKINLTQAKTKIKNLLLYNNIVYNEIVRRPQLYNSIRRYFTPGFTNQDFIDLVSDLNHELYQMVEMN
jgi:hypothetical protein